VRAPSGDGAEYEIDLNKQTARAFRKQLAPSPGTPVRRTLRVSDPRVLAIHARWRVLATSLYDDPAAELYEDASARLHEHPALLGCLILRRSSPPSSVGGHQDLAGGHEEGTAAITESDRILGTLRCGSAADRRIFAVNG